MKIGIITDAIDDGTAGIATYVRNLVEELHNLDKKNEYYLIHNKLNKDYIYKNKNEIIIPIRNIPFAREFRKLIEIPFRLKNHKLDIVHETAQIGPFLFPTKYKKITTICDLVPLVVPETQPKFSVVHHKFALPIISKRTDKIITISESTKRDVNKKLNIDKEKITVTLLAANKSFKPVKSKQVLKKNNLKENYILCVGTLEPRKNIIGVVKAFSKVLKNNPTEHLLIVGRKGWKYQEIFKLVKTKKLENKITFLENIETKDLPALYAHAKMFVYPSLYEGFGLPPLEAMSCKCPVITSNNSSLPEVVKDAAILITPRNTKQLQLSMELLITNKHLRTKLIKAGIKQAKKFSWKETARQTLKIYNSLN
jgi:glycosyltransferase involved in cell wall biosynthesis